MKIVCLIKIICFVDVHSAFANVLWSDLCFETIPYSLQCQKSKSLKGYFKASLCVISLYCTFEVDGTGTISFIYQGGNVHFIEVKELA